MSIIFYEEEKIFKLDTPESSYVIGIVDDEQFLGHVYYGAQLKDHQLGYLMRTGENPFIPAANNRDRVSFLDCFPMEYPAHGLGDYRESCIEVQTLSGHTGTSLSYISHHIYQGKPELKELPATFGSGEECETLEILCEDKVTGVQVLLLYAAFRELDVISRSVKVINGGREAVYLKKVLSACLDVDNQEFEMLSMHGSWSRERHIQRQRLGYGRLSVESVRGESSHQEHPFAALVETGTTQDAGAVYAMHFVYSGNFKVQAQVDQFDQVRMVMGIHPTDFCWKLEPGEEFQTPEVVMVYSGEGLGKMTRTFHDLYRSHLIRSPYKDKKRPVLINNWEATYFDFNTDKLIEIARQAAARGIEMLVMDDGWFGHRNDDNCALGDWDVNEDKLPGGLPYLVAEVNKLGLKFGIWLEPEMISPDSDLYRKHPDWAIAIPGREAGLARNQYVLDLSREEVFEYIYGKIAEVLRSANIEYVKWDMNRPLSDMGSAALPADRMGELHHRYVLALYRMQERLLQDFPDLLLENCSSGGARFDPGMLYYSPQIWCSDDTDAIERLLIQEGTALIYPLSAIGAHVSDCPNHGTGRLTPFETRGYVALAGTFGYELDITKIPPADQEQIPGQVALYHKYNDLIRTGDYYRLASYRENHFYDCYGVVSKDKKEALFTFIQVLNRPHHRSRRIKLKGLQEDKYYRVEDSGEIYAGDTLLKAGILIPSLWGDFKGRLLHLIEIENSSI